MRYAPRHWPGLINLARKNPLFVGSGGEAHRGSTAITFNQMANLDEKAWSRLLATCLTHVLERVTCQHKGPCERLGLLQRQIPWRQISGPQAIIQAHLAPMWEHPQDQRINVPV